MALVVSTNFDVSYVVFSLPCNSKYFEISTVISFLSPWLLRSMHRLLRSTHCLHLNFQIYEDFLLIFCGQFLASFYCYQRTQSNFNPLKCVETYSMAHHMVDFCKWSVHAKEKCVLYSPEA